MHVVLKTARLGFSKSINLFDMNGEKLFTAKYKLRSLLKMRFIFNDPLGQQLLTMSQDHAFFKTSFSIRDGEAVIGKAGSNWAYSRGFIELPSTGRLEMSFGWGFKTAFTLDGIQGAAARINQAGFSWRVSILKKYPLKPFLAGLCILYHVYMDRG